MAESASHLGVLLIELFIPASGSLKSKRRILKSLKDRLRSKFNVSVAEVGYLDKWQRAVLGTCMIGVDKRYLDGSLQAVLSFVEGIRNVEVTKSRIEFL